MVTKDQTKEQITAQYAACLVEGRSEWCPRKGIYKILSIYKGQCLNKPAVMATTYWKASLEEEYSGTIFVIQLESFLLRADCIDTACFLTRRMIGHEIEVQTASYDTQFKKFDMQWEAHYLNLNDQEVIDLSNQALTIEELRGLLSAGMIDPNLDDEFEEDFYDSDDDLYLD